MTTVKKITVSIFGEHYHLVSDEPENDVREAARVAESTLAELREKSQRKDVSESHITTLALLKLGLQATRQEKELALVQQRVHALLDLVETMATKAT
jgi:cell division protein ZapA (FtsZ GTPase activity inhibitor)